MIKLAPRPGLSTWPRVTSLGGHKQCWSETRTSRSLSDPTCVSHGNCYKHNHSECLLGTGPRTGYAFSHLTKAWEQWSSKCGTNASSISITWALVGKTQSLSCPRHIDQKVWGWGRAAQGLPHPPGDSDSSTSWESLVWEPTTQRDWRICVELRGWCLWQGKDFNSILHDSRVQAVNHYTVGLCASLPSFLSFLCAKHRVRLLGTHWRPED